MADRTDPDSVGGQDSMESPAAKSAGARGPEVEILRKVLREKMRRNKAAMETDLAMRCAVHRERIHRFVYEDGELKGEERAAIMDVLQESVGS